MKKLLDIKRFKLYVWIGLGDLGLGLLGDLVQHTLEMGGRTPNNIWLIGICDPDQLYLF